MSEAFINRPLEKLNGKFKETDNEFIRDVKNRYERIKAQICQVQSVECYSCFLLKGCKITDLKGKPGCPRDASTYDAFEKLVRFLEQNDECQYQLGELLEKFNSYTTTRVEETYITKHLRRRLKEHFGENIIISEEYGISSVVTFKEQAHNILREKWGTDKDNVDEKKLIIDMAASFIRDSIRSKAYSLDKYPDLNDLD